MPRGRHRLRRPALLGRDSWGPSLPLPATLPVSALGAGLGARLGAQGAGGPGGPVLPRRAGISAIYKAT